METRQDSAAGLCEQVRVKAFPGARAETVRKVGEHAYEITVREPARKNLANARILALIAREYGVPVEAARIRTGRTSPRKLIDIIR